MSAKSKSFNMRIKEATDRGREDIANEVRKERDASYVNDLAKLSREFARQMADGKYSAAQATLKTIVTSTNKKITGLEHEVNLGN